ncbi:DeoR/GlpR transcriptional regulator [Actinosynnema pretiosum subsp. pretiosum]|uniref:Lactose phosphotransferase system repressor n=2 Tax=Actinosynnema TaxID=40566 RepID=C6WPV9_ACTMD|nr:DeoR/GlpR family DNA-binding transcription regulator [Actinosynnema mirum]ACU35015.1 transcriptional regulator, DeoR family [Actinosynnema mirum DSM 43827]AXX28387.1 Transcriptional repressor of the fructose operon, DeoR family [Actinosynnema pretiosum subsp. pretiosum]QUF07259.1 DeoR/GlpR transcriptional regulator [Actinosynnema pretiosum subsp. pretiosum]
MYAAERHALLAQRARRDGRVDVSDMAEELGVAPETIRRDLGVLERQGLVRRVYGGAVAVDRLDVEPGVAQRDRTNAAEKDRIARAALDHLPERGSVLLDAGTTTARLAALLPTDRELTVITNSVPIATAVAARPNATLHLLGGRVRGATLASVESWALDALEGLLVDVVFLGANGFSAQRGCTTPDLAEAAVKTAMVSAARRRVLLADHGKHGTDQLSRFAKLSDLDVLISDSGLDRAAARELESEGPSVVLA